MPGCVPASKVHGDRCAYPGTCHSPSRSWWSHSPQPDAGSWLNLIHLERTGPPSWAATQWLPLISGHRPVTSARLSHQGPAPTLCPWKRWDAYSLKGRRDKLIKLEKYKRYDCGYCSSDSSCFSVQMKPVLLEVLQHEPTQQGGNKVIHWLAVRFPLTSWLYCSLHAVRLSNLGKWWNK